MFTIGENTSNFIEGTIASVTDNENWGRVRVHITGYTEGIPVPELPYARVLSPLNSSLDKSDSTAQIGTPVLMIMLNNDINSLVILGRFKQKSQAQSL